MARGAESGVMSIALAEQNVYAAQFTATRERLPGNQLSGIDRLRREGMDDFLALGFPTTKLENWKYTNVAPIRRIPFDASIPEYENELPAASRLGRLVFVNGRFAPNLSIVDRKLNFQVLPITEALRDPERAF